MKKLILIPAAILLFAACNKEEKKMEMEKVGEVKSAQPALSVTTNITVLNNDKNSNAVFFINDISKSNDDNISITFYEPYTENDFIITKNYPMNGAYGISLSPKSKTTNAYGFNIKVINKENKELINEDVIFFALKKLYPAYADNNTTPMLDDDVLLFNKDIKEQYVLLNQVQEENYTVIENGKYQDNVVKDMTPLTEYGFSNKFTGSLKENTNEIYIVDNKTDKFEVNGTSYNNCLLNSGIHTKYPCALKITSNGEKSEASFYLRLNDKYIDTKINLKTE